MNWVVDQAEKPVAQIVGSSIISACPDRNLLGFISGNRVYNWMGVPVGYRHGRYLTNTLGRVVGRIVVLDSRAVPEGGTTELLGEPRWSARVWDHFLPKPPQKRAECLRVRRPMAAD